MWSKHTKLKFFMQPFQQILIYANLWTLFIIIYYYDSIGIKLYSKFWHFLKKKKLAFSIFSLFLRYLTLWVWFGPMSSHFKEKSVIINISINPSQSNSQIFLCQINVEPRLSTVKFWESFWSTNDILVILIIEPQNWLVWHPIKTN